MMAEGEIVFVTVGTTSFDNLIAKVTSIEICDILYKAGYQKLLLQVGKGEYLPDEKQVKGVSIEFYRYKDSIQNDIQNAGLVISHAGAGSCLEVLCAKKPLVVVVNEELMDNHQTELAAKLQQDGHVVYGTCKELAEKLQDLNVSSLKMFEPGRPEKFSSFLDKVTGLS